MVISHPAYNYRISKIRAYVIKSNIRQYSLRNCSGFSHNFDSGRGAETESIWATAQASCYKYIVWDPDLNTSPGFSFWIPVFGLLCSVRWLCLAGVKIMNALCYRNQSRHWVRRLISSPSRSSGPEISIFRPLGYEPLKISVWTCELISVGE